MKRILIPALLLSLAAPLRADEPELAKKVSEHQQGSEKLAGEQDELSGDLQQLVLEQTSQKVIQLLRECEEMMADATERLGSHDTGGETIASQTEIIEKIHEAAKAKQQNGEGSQAGGAMMDMLERMMGKQPEGEGQKPGGKPGDQGGQGMTGESDTANAGTGEGGAGAKEERRVPKAAGTAGKAVPEEFRKAFDAYNRGAGKLAK